MDNFTESESEKLELIHKIQELHQEGVSIHKIARITGKNRNTVKKYLEGDPNNLCRNSRHSVLEGYKDFIIKAIKGGQTQTDIVKALGCMGYTGSTSNARQYISSVVKQYNLEIAKYRSLSPKESENAANVEKPKVDYITRKGVFNYLWMNCELTSWHHTQLWGKYPVLKEVELCIRQFREIFNKKNMALLYIFIERYKQSSIKELASFANGLEKDLAAVENAVASPLSNGFVEGTNSRVKMVKRTMYGRCGIKLLSAKLMYQGT